MPRLAVSKEEEMNRVIRGSIKGSIELQGMNVAKLSKLTGVPAPTLYQKIREPERFTVRELRAIFRVLRYSEEDKERIAREAV